MIKSGFVRPQGEAPRDYFDRAESRVSLQVVRVLEGRTQNPPFGIVSQAGLYRGAGRLLRYP
jgi:hypothetical protein